MRLIDADELIHEIWRIPEIDMVGTCTDTSYLAVEHAIKEAPTIPAFQQGYEKGKKEAAKEIKKRMWKLAQNIGEGCDDDVVGYDEALIDVDQLIHEYEESDCKESEDEKNG